MASIWFLPFDKEIKSENGLGIMHAAVILRLPIYSTCGAKGACGKCRVIIEKIEGPISPPSDRERELLGALLEKGFRLACETVLQGSAVVRIPEESRIKRQIILTAGNEHLFSVRLLPDTEKYYLNVETPTIDRPTADRERLLRALEKTYRIKKSRLDPFVLRKLPAALSSNPKGVTLSIWRKTEIVDIVAGQSAGLYGVAADIGTTTVVVYLLDLEKGQEIAVKTATNPQISFGDDVISRISSCQRQAGALETQRAAIVQCLNALVEEASSEVGIDPTRIVEMTAVGNTTMHHLLLGIDPGGLSRTPYPPVLQDSQDVKARDLGLEIGPSAYVHLLPLKAGFVGSDAMAGILATGIHRSKTLSLLIDIGTNGEIVLGNKDRLICCSTAAGPAFEGGHIRWGMRAETGAIEKVKLDPRTLEVKIETIDNHRPVGLCGSGVIAAVAEMIRSGIILSRGNFNKDIDAPRLRDGEQGREFVLAWAEETAIGQDIVLTQKDVSEIQMAKSAIYSGTLLLQEISGFEQIQRILLAGACGNYIDPLDACKIGLFPGGDSARIAGVGNAAGYGACLSLLNRNKRKEAQKVAMTTSYQELAASDRFQDLFISNLFFTSAVDYDEGLRD